YFFLKILPAVPHSDFNKFSRGKISLIFGTVASFNSALLLLRGATYDPVKLLPISHYLLIPMAILCITGIYFGLTTEERKFKVRGVSLNILGLFLLWALIHFLH